MSRLIASQAELHEAGDCAVTCRYCAEDDAYEAWLAEDNNDVW